MDDCVYRDVCPHALRIRPRSVVSVLQVALPSLPLPCIVGVHDWLPHAHLVYGIGKKIQGHYSISVCVVVLYFMLTL